MKNLKYCINCFLFYFNKTKNMENKRYLVAFDLETTGTDKSKDQIIQFSGIKFDYNNFEQVDSLDLKICPDGPFAISIQAYMKHGVKPEDLMDKPHLADVADQIIEFIGDNDILTYNGTNFDIPFLICSLSKIGKTINFLNRKCYDVYAEEKRRNGMHLEDVFSRYTGKTMEEAGYEAHNALGDSMATVDIFKEQMKIKEFCPEKMISEDNVIVNSNFQGKEMPCFNIGKYKDLPVAYISKFDQGYLHWCIDKASFLDSTKNFIKNYIQ